MKKIKLHQKVEEAGREREERWRELRMIMERNEGVDKSKLKLIQQGEKLSEVDQLLKEIGLEKYSSLMKENGIDDMEILMELQESHLEEIGIILGHRLKILKKIRELKEESTSKSSKPTKSPDSTPSHPTRSNPSPSSRAPNPNLNLNPNLNPVPNPKPPALNSSSKPAAYSKSPQVAKPSHQLPRNPNSKFISTAEIFSSLEKEKEKPIQPVQLIQTIKPVQVIEPTQPTKPTKSVSNQSSHSTSNPVLNVKPDLSKQVSKKTQDTCMDTNDLQAQVIENFHSEGSLKNFPKANNSSQGQADINSKGKEAIIYLNRPPASSKPATVGKNLALFQPNSQETEKIVKLSEFIPASEAINPKEEIKWEGFSYVPYKPSEEIQAISHKPSSRPVSAKSELKHVERLENKTENKDKFDVVGWDN